MLLNEFLKERRKVADQSEQIAELKATVAKLKSAFKARAAQIQKVSDQLGTQVLSPRVWRMIDPSKISRKGIAVRGAPDYFRAIAPIAQPDRASDF